MLEDSCVLLLIATGKLGIGSSTGATRGIGSSIGAAGRGVEGPTCGGLDAVD